MTGIEKTVGPDALAMDLKNLSSSIGVTAERILRALCVEAHATIVFATPVKTGRARGNWIVTIGVPALEARDVVSADLPRLMSEARALIDTADSDSSVYITNNVKYIQRLNDGWSAQAAKGFIETSLMKAIKFLPQSLEGLK